MTVIVVFSVAVDLLGLVSVIVAVTVLPPVGLSTMIHSVTVLVTVLVGLPSTVTVIVASVVIVEV